MRLVMQRLAMISLALAVLAIMAGCGKKRDVGGPVSGTIKYKGQPVNNAGIMIYLKGGNKSSAFTTNAEGEYHILEVPEGEYKVVIQPATGEIYMPSTKGMDKAKAEELKAKFEALKPPKTIKIPEKYMKADKTDLKLTVTKEKQTIDFELKD